MLSYLCVAWLGLWLQQTSPVPSVQVSPMQSLGETTKRLGYENRNPVGRRRHADWAFFEPPPQNFPKGTRFLDLDGDGVLEIVEAYGKILFIRSYQEHGYLAGRMMGFEYDIVAYAFSETNLPGGPKLLVAWVKDIEYASDELHIDIHDPITLEKVAGDVKLISGYNRTFRFEDMNGDGVSDLVFKYFHYDDKWNMRFLDGLDFDCLLGEFIQEDDFRYEIGDFLPTPDKEVYLSSHGNSGDQVVNLNGEILWEPDGSGTYLSQVVDVDGDGLDEMVFKNGYDFSVIDVDLDSVKWERSEDVSIRSAYQVPGSGGVNFVLSSYSDSRYELWDGVTGQTLGYLPLEDAYEYAFIMDVDSDGRLELLKGFYYLDVYDFDSLDTIVQADEINGDRRAFTIADVNQDGLKELLLATEYEFVSDDDNDGAIHYFDGRTRELMFRSQGLDQVENGKIKSIACGAFSDGARLAVAFEDRVVIYRANDLAYLGVLPEEDENIRYSRVDQADLDGDGQDEFIVVHSDNSFYRFIVYDGLTLQQRWSTEAVHVPYGLFDLHMANLDDDPQLELIFSKSGAIFAYDGVTGSLEVNLETPTPGAAFGFASADTNGDGRLELLIGDKVGLYESHVWIYDVQTWEIIQMLTVPVSIRDIAFGDFNHDGVNELIVLTYNHVFIYDAEYGSAIWNGSLNHSKNFDRQVRFAVEDLDGDGEIEIVVGAEDYLMIYEPEYCRAMGVSVEIDPPTGCVFEPVTMGVSAFGADLTYQWYRYTTLIEGATEPTFTLIPDYDFRSGHYTCHVTDGCGNTLESDRISIGVWPTPRILEQPKGQVSCLGESTMLSIGINDDGYTDVQWYHNGVPVPGETETQLVISEVSMADLGAYQVSLQMFGNCEIFSDEVDLIGSYCHFQEAWPAWRHSGLALCHTLDSNILHFVEAVSNGGNCP